MYSYYENIKELKMKLQNNTMANTFISFAQYVA